MEKHLFIPNIPDTNKKRVVIIGSGFGGLKLLQKLKGKGFQIVLLDKNNFHQFQPLLYQVATAGLEPSSISFPIRKILQKERDIFFRIAEIAEIKATDKIILTSIGALRYDYLVLATGTNTNFFNSTSIEQNALSMKTASDAILIRNTILENFEKALLEPDANKIDKYLNVVLVGGGATGVELAGAIAEMKKYIFPKEYPELDLSKMRIVLYEAGERVLAGMSKHASEKALSYLQNLNVEVTLKSMVQDYNGKVLSLADGQTIETRTVIWAAGVAANRLKGIKSASYSRGNRLLVDRFNQLQGMTDVFAIGDACLMPTTKYPEGHPQVAQPAIQQAMLLAKNLKKIQSGVQLKEYEYKDKGSLATIGRNLAVADLPAIKLKGFIAWVLWLFVHLMSIVGVKNRLFIFLNWMWNYVTYDQSLRLLIKPKVKNSTVD